MKKGKLAGILGLSLGALIAINCNSDIKKIEVSKIKINEKDYKQKEIIPKKVEV